MAPSLVTCSSCDRHIKADAPCCPFCCQRNAKRAALALVAAAGLAGCGNQPPACVERPTVTLYGSSVLATPCTEPDGGVLENE
jgi:hypothetical protein